MQENRWRILIIVGLATFMADLDASIVNVAVPVINTDLNINMGLAELVIAIYLITICVFLLPFGRLSDMIGRSRLFKLGLLVFTIGSLLCGISMNLPALLLARFLQAIGAAFIMSTNNGLITEVFPVAERGRALGWIGAFVALGMIAGPGIGGMLLAYFSWQIIFWINVPIGGLLIIWGQFVLPKEHLNIKQTFDWPGTILSGVAIAGIFMYLYAGQQIGYANSWLIACLVLAIISGVLFVFAERKVAAPLITLALMKNRALVVGLGSAVLIFITNNFYMMLTPFYFENALHISVNKTGLLMMLLPLVQIVVSPIAGSLADKFGSTRVLMIGLCILLVSEVGFVLAGVASSLILYVGAIGVLGLGNAIFQSPNNAMIMSAVSADQLGMAGGLNSLSRNIGAVAGNALATTLTFGAMSFVLGRHVNNYVKGRPQVYLTGQTFVYSVGTVLIGMCLILCILSYKKIRKQGNNL